MEGDGCVGGGIFKARLEELREEKLSMGAEGGVRIFFQRQCLSEFCISHLFFFFFTLGDFTPNIF